MDKKYDVIVVGAGPAGIFATLELIKRCEDDINILILEKGKDIIKRKCLMRDKKIDCQRCNPCSLLSGWGGGGAFSDGKLNLTTDFGGNLSDYIGSDELHHLINYVDNIYCQFGAEDSIYGGSQEEVEQIKRDASKAG